MTPEAQRIAIAEACGWERPWKMSVGNGNFMFIGKRPENEGSTPVPDYLTDLNAMHEVEKVLTDKQYQHYVNNKLVLASVNNGTGRRHSSCATAAQRAEAFLRVIGKWVDSPSDNIPT